MRILVTADVIGGVWTFASRLCADLSTRGHEVHLVLFGGDPDEHQQHALERAGLASWAARDWKLEWMNDPWADIARTEELLADLVGRLRPDVVHLNTYASVAGAPVVLTLHSCVLSWWRAVHQTETPASWNRYRDLVTSAIGAATVVAAPTKWLLDEMDSLYGGLGYGSVIPNGVDGAPGAFRESFVLSAGRLWDPAKNVGVLAAAARDLGVRVIVAGAGEAPGLECRGRLPAHRLHDLMRRAAVYAHPARYEPFGLAPLEAAARGCPLLLAEIPSLIEVWDGAAEFLPPGDEGAWKDGLARLLADPRRRAELARRARARAAQLTPARTTSGYLEAYERALTGVPA